MVSPLSELTQAAFDALAQYRLNKNLSFHQLSEEMKRVGWYVPQRSLHLALTGRVVPVDRTQHRIEQFVLTLRLHERPIAKRRGTAA